MFNDSINTYVAVRKNLKEQIIDLLNLGIAECEIAKSLGCSVPAISYHKKKNGYELHRSKIFNYEEIQKYYDKGHTISEIYLEFGICAATLDKARKSGKFKSRTLSEATKLYRRKNPITMSKETKDKISKSRKKYLEENPESHPQRILAHNRKNWSYPEKIFADRLDLLQIPFIHNKRILTYYPDFLFENNMLIVEIDGEWFHKDKERDAKRQQKLEDAGYKVIRFSAKEISKNLDQCIEITLDLLDN